MWKARLASARRLRTLRTQRGLTQGEVSRQLEVLGVKYSQARLSRLECRWNQLELRLAICLALILNTSVAYLLVQTEDPAPQPIDPVPSSDPDREAVRLADNLLARDRRAVSEALKCLLQKSVAGTLVCFALWVTVLPPNLR